MTHAEIARLLDKVGTLDVDLRSGTLTITVRILDGREAYGRQDVLVTPVPTVCGNCHGPLMRRDDGAWGHEEYGAPYGSDCPDVRGPIGNGTAVNGSGEAWVSADRVKVGK